MILMRSSRPSGSKPHDSTAKREQNPHYGHYNGLIEAPNTNTNAAFNFYGELMAVKSMAEVIELSTSLLRAW